MNIGDVKVDNNYLKASFKGSSIQEAKMAEAPIIHWLPAKDIIKIILVMFTGERIEGFAEKSLAEEPLNSLVQLERVGFGRIDSKSDDRIVVYFTSR
jgi:glutamyl-tRNA synthetase